MGQIYRSVIEACLDCLFPPVCVSCRQHGAWWCLACREAIELMRDDEAMALPGVDAWRAMGLYHDPRLRSAVHALKYKGGSALVPDIVSVVGAWSVHRDIPWAGERGLAVQPLVATPGRVRERGFDQAELLATGLGAIVAPHAPIMGALMRHDAAAAQATIEDHGLRAANVAGMFMLRPVHTLPESVLLIDDVITSGSTLAEAATVLRSGGVRRVYGFALAMGK